MTDDRSSAATVLLAVTVGIGGYLAVLAWAIVLLTFARSIAAPIDPIERQAINAAALALGTLLAVRVYLVATDRTATFLDMGRPTTRQAILGVATIPVLFGVGMLLGELGISPAEHGLEAAVRAGGLPVAVVLAVTSVLVVGPAEELLYRNLVQKTLAERFSTPAAIAGASAIFAAAHTTAYWGGDLGAFLSALGIVFALSAILGWVYAITDRVMVPAIAHGGYDAVVFLLIAVDPLAV
ncbi:MAG: lysostaphin resistance A-like protein [Halobacteriaceae archaeon]